MTIPAGRFALVLALAVSGVQPGCRPAPREEVLRVVSRFADDAQRGLVQASCRPEQDGSTVGRDPAAVMTIADDVRKVLWSAPGQALVFQPGMIVPPTRTESLRIPVKDKLVGAQRVVVETTFRYDGRWTTLPGNTVDVVHAPLGDVIPVRVELPASIPVGATVALHVVGRRAECATGVVQETAEVTLAGNSSLDFSIGLTPVAASAGPVRFAIDACRASGCASIFDETVRPADQGAFSWKDRNVAVAGQAGDRVRFVFRVEGGNEVATVAAGWGDPSVYRSDGRDPDEPNILLVSIDTLAASHLAAYGYALDTMPFVGAKVARDGSLFEHCVASATATGPSHMSMFTSYNPSVHGVTTGDESLPPWIETVTERLRNAGFATGAATEDGWLGIRQGFGRGFGSYVESRNADPSEPKGEIARTLGRAGDWMERNRNKRFFYFVHTYQVHSPYLPPPAYQSLFPSAAGGAKAGEEPRYVQERRAYDQEIRYADDELRAFLERLQKLGLDRNTIVILLSDHGEEFLEHGALRHGANPYEEVIHVPLFVWGPGIAAGRRVGEVVGHVDLMPTILDLMHLPVPEGLQGRSLVPWLSDGMASGPRPNPVYFSESWGRDQTRGVDYEVVRFPRPAFAARRSGTKLIRNRTDGGSRFEHYDLEHDPLERRDLFPSAAGDGVELERRLAEYERESDAFRSRLEKGPGTTEVPESMDPQQQDRLRALGYLQ